MLVSKFRNNFNHNANNSVIIMKYNDVSPTKLSKQHNKVKLIAFNVHYSYNTFELNFNNMQKKHLKTSHSHHTKHNKYYFKVFVT